MKKLWIICSCLFLLSCMANVRIRVLQSAGITVPAKIQTLSLLNRYKPDKDRKFLNVLEGFITGEGIGQDRRGADASLNALTTVLASSPRFTVTRPGIDLPGSGTAAFPPLLDASLVKKICQENSSQGMVTIEAFDSNSKLEYGQYLRSTKTKQGEEIKVPVSTVKATIFVTTGWRMYDGLTGELIDETRMTQPVVFNAEGATQQAAAANLPNREAIIQRIGDVMGGSYAARISPTWIWVHREWYKKAKRNRDMETGKNLMLANNFDEALNYYLDASRSRDPKVASRAYYNLAIVMETKGELEQAVKYCDESVKLGNKNAIKYRRILRYRINEAERVSRQLQGS